MTAARPRLLLAPALAGSLLLASLLLAGCSQPDSGSDEAARAHASAAASQASQPAAAGGQPSATPSPNVWLTTPAVGARVSGKTPLECLADIKHVLPDAVPNPTLLAVLGRLS